MVSFSQNGEDVVLRRAFRDLGRPGFYVDVGACHPTEDSVTLHFYERGWRGINVEPDEALLAALAHGRPRDVNLRAAVGRARGQAVFQATGVRGHGTLDPDLARARAGNAEGVRVPVLTLPDLIDLYGPEDREVAFLKVDVEGWEAEVLASGDWERHRPVIILVEAVDEEGRPTHETWEPALLASRYCFALFDGLNRFYVREEDSERLLPRIAAPANVLDGWRHAREVEALRRAEVMTAECAAAEARAEALGADAEEARAAAEKMDHLRRELTAAWEASEVLGAEARAALEGMRARVTVLEAEAVALRREEATAEREVMEAEIQRAREAEAAALRREEAAEARMAELETTAALRSAPPAPCDRPEIIARNATLEAQSAELREQLARLDAHLEAVRRSTSWRVSYPVRLTGRMIKRAVGRDG
jgi:FkbM family methyltransferase